jgi:hypothetical protein
MIQLKNNEIFLYLEREISSQRSLNQKIFSNFIYPWKYCCTSNFIREYGKCREHPEIERFKRISAKDLRELSGKLNFILIPNHKIVDRSILLISNPDYKSSYYSDGAHSDIWLTLQKGVDLKTLEKFKREINMGFDVDPVYACAIEPIDLNRDL